MATSSSLRLRGARWMALRVNALSRLLGRGSGTVAGGRVALRLAPDLVARLAPRTTVLITGTNGKTTTAAMIAATRRVLGEGVIANDTGANMPAGIAAALCSQVGTTGVFEVDEAYVGSVLESLPSATLVVLNLSRDQLDRASEMRQLAERWRRATNKSQVPTLRVVANANDPLVVYALEEAATVIWCDVEHDWRDDALSCPKCTNLITFDADGWRCACGFERPTCAVRQRGTEVSLFGDLVELQLQLPGVFNCVNATMALASLGSMSHDERDVCVRALEELASVQGRFADLDVDGVALHVTMSKNPAGFVALFSTIPQGDEPLLIAINDNVADGRDPSWLYDVPFERCRGHVVYCYGTRRLDLATRLWYAGVEAHVVTSLSEIPTSTRLFTIANYTAFAQLLAKGTA